MPRMRPATRSGWKASSASIFSPTPANLIGLPVTARIDSAAPPRASPSIRVRTTPVSGDLVGEALGDVDRVLAGQRVDDEQDLVRAGRPRRPPSSRPSAPGRRGGGRRCRASARRSPAASRRCSARRAISTGGWPATIGRVATSACWPSTASCSCAAGRLTSSDAISTFLRSFSLQPLGELGGGGRLARALQADHHDHRRRRRPPSSSPASSPPSISTSASLTILTTCWPGVTERSTCWPTAFSVTLSTKVRDHRQRDVGLEQGDPHLAHRLAHVRLAQRAAAAQPVEDAAQTIAKAFEHRPLLKTPPNAKTPAGETSPASVRPWRFNAHPWSGWRAA